MKQITFIFIILLLAISHGYADGNPAEAAEHWEKVRQMDQLAERFKAETGFTGSIQHNLERMRLSYFEGKFAGIQITATADTASFRAVFEQILDKALPYTYAKREQLSRSRITNNLGIIQTDYYQQVNGYRVEGAGRLTINYETGRNAFAIGNGTVELPDVDVRNMITKEEAEKTALIDKNDSRYQKAKVKSIFYTNLGSDAYYLAYLVLVSDDSKPILGDYTYYIDGITGKVLNKYPTNHIHYDLSVHVEGKDYIESSYWNVPPTDSQDAADEIVSYI